MKKNGDKKVNQKKGKGSKTLSPKSKKVWKFFDNKTIKEKELKIKVLKHELLAFTLSSLTLAPW
jgi:hypothetical protein